MARRERVITNVRDIPAGFVAMNSIAAPDYDRIKKAVSRKEIDAVCLFPNGERKWRPRKWVDGGQVKQWLSERRARSEAKNVFVVPPPTRIPQTIPGIGTDSLDAEIRQSVFLKMSELVNAITILTSSIQVVTEQLGNAIAAQGDREPFSLSQGN